MCASRRASVPAHLPAEASTLALRQHHQGCRCTAIHERSPGRQRTCSAGQGASFEAPSVNTRAAMGCAGCVSLLPALGAASNAHSLSASMLFTLPRGCCSRLPTCQHVARHVGESCIAQRLCRQAAAQPIATQPQGHAWVDLPGGWERAREGVVGQDEPQPPVGYKLPWNGAGECVACGASKSRRVAS